MTRPLDRGYRAVLYRSRALPATVISLPSREPGQSRYGALAASLRARVVSGEWPPGSAIPAEQMLAAEHGVALGTLRRALELLAQEGLVERVHGRGTFVRAGLTGGTMMRFFRFAHGGGEVPASRILSRQASNLPAEPARALGVAKGGPALKLRRLRSLGDEPCLIEEIWLPLPAFDALAQGDPREWGPLLYPLYAERCGIHVHRAVDDIRFDALAAADARALGLPPGHPCARVTRSAFDVTGRCIEHRVSRGDAYAFQYTVSIT
jgi:GntR family transcriptional regulator